MTRTDADELLEDPSLPADVVATAYRDLARTQRLLGNNYAIFRRLRKIREPIRRVLSCWESWATEVPGVTLNTRPPFCARMSETNMVLPPFRKLP